MPLAANNFSTCLPTAYNSLPNPNTLAHQTYDMSVGDAFKSSSIRFYFHGPCHFWLAIERGFAYNNSDFIIRRVFLAKTIQENVTHLINVAVAKISFILLSCAHAAAN